MKTKIGIDGPYTQAGVTISPVFQSRTTVFTGGATGEKVPLGLLVHSGTRLSLISFTGSYAWWDELVSDYPALQTLHPAFPERSPERPKK